MRDFTNLVYKFFLQKLYSKGYSFYTLKSFIKQVQIGKVIILRHDVDRLAKNALAIAKIEKSLNIKASYYFRIVKESYDENIIKQIADLGHEIGYHYEDLSICKGDYESAIKHFELNLEKFGSVGGRPLVYWFLSLRGQVLI